MIFTIRQGLNYLQFPMSKKKYLIFFLIFILLSNCSFDSKSAVSKSIWTGEEDEKQRMSEIEEQQLKEKNREKIYSSGKIYTTEKNLANKIVLSKPEKNLEWKTSSLNNQNFLGNRYLSSINNKFLKKKNWKK